jgi:hypothetical protein
MGIPTDTGRHHLNHLQAEEDSTALQSSSLDPHNTLEEITRNAQHLTGASGAALALSIGKVISCRACSGYLTPPVGTQLNTHTGLTATCVQTAEIVRCDNTQTDPRVDSSKCVGVRSILAVPVFDGPDVAGVLEVFSSNPNRFTDRHAIVLQLLARLVETHLNYVPRGNTPPASDAKPKRKDLDGSNSEPSGVGCLSCGQRNPQGSQFCNRCGVILCISPQPDRSIDLSLTEGMQPIDREGLREIYKLIVGDAGRATWNEIYAKLLANQQNPSAPTTAETAKKKDTPKAFGRTDAKNELTA